MTPVADQQVLSIVIKETLESTDIDVGCILRDAEEKENQLQAKINKATDEIEQFKATENKYKCIYKFQKDLEET